MGKRKKSGHKKGNAVASTNSTAESDKAAKQSEATPSEEEKIDNDPLLEQKLAGINLAQDDQLWEAHKSKGNALYGETKYQEALDQYSLAIEALENHKNARVHDEELAKLYGNRSITYHKMSLACTGADDRASLCEKALEDGRRAVELDEKYEKGYFRCVAALSSVGRKGEAIDYLKKILQLYAKDRKSWQDDPHLKKLMVECRYMSATKTESPNWDRVKFKDNCVVLDPNGFGDVTALNSKMIHENKKLSVLVKPSRYSFECLLVANDDELDIVGDVDANESPEDVVFCCQGSGIGNIFMVAGGMLSLENISIRQESHHPERHGVFASSRAVIKMTNCYGYSHSSGCIAVTQFSQLCLSKSTIDGACGGVIVVGSASAIIEKCFVKNCDRIGVEVRAGGVLLMTDTEISLCGSQGLVTHADAGACVVESCVFYGNCRKLQDQASVTVARSIAYIHDTQITSIRGYCVMVQEGGTMELDCCRLAGGQVSVGCSLNGSARITSCKMANCNYGVMLVMNQPGQIVMRDNEIKARMSEIGITKNDVPPLMLGAKRHTVKKLDEPSSGYSRNRLQRDKERLNADQFQVGMRWEDPRNSKMLATRVCFPCGLGQSSVGRNFLPCEGCRLYWYCSRRCQLKDLSLHQPMCLKIQEIWKSEPSSASSAEPPEK